MFGTLPMLAEATHELPGGPGWLYEPKYDGVRALGRVTASGANLLSRKGNPLTRQFPEIAGPLQRLHAAIGQEFLVDGEIVSATDDGFAGFQTLQSRLGVEQPFRIRMLALRIPAVLVCFDVLAVGATSLVGHPLYERREVLQALLCTPFDGLRLGEQSDDGPGMLRRATALGWEGIVAKWRDSRYLPGQRSPTWLKYKATRRQEFVVAGFTDSDAEGRELAALVLGYHAAGRLVYAGCVGSGFTAREVVQALRRLAPLARPASPFPVVPAVDGRVHWVEPRTVVEVRFQDWTDDGRVRFPVFLGFRDDKSPDEVVREG